MRIGKAKAKQIILSTFILASAILLLWCYYKFSPKALSLEYQKNESLKLKEEIEFLRLTDLPQKKKQAEELKDLENLLEDALEKISMVEEKLPDNQDLGYLLSSLTSLAKEPGVDFFRISCGDVKGGMEFSEIPVDINLSCRFLELGKYLEGLEKLDRLVNVKSFEIDLDQENIPKVKAKIKASVFVLQE